MTTNKDSGILWAFKQRTSFSTIPRTDDFDAYSKAILICANGDGNLAPLEREWVLGYFAAFGAPDSVLEEIKSYKADEDLEKLMAITPATNASRRFLVYDAIQACSADGQYNDRERAMVIRMAAKLGVSEDVVRQVEEICVEEAQLREKRLKLMYPEGAPL